FLEQPIRTRGLQFIGRRAAFVVVPLSVAAAIGSIVAGTVPRPPLLRARAVPIVTEVPDEAIQVRIMVLGDSTANSLGWVIRGIHDPRITVVNRGQDGCSMLRDSCDGPKWLDLKNEVRPGI